MSHYVFYCSTYDFIIIRYMEAGKYVRDFVQLNENTGNEEYKLLGEL